MDDPPQLAPDGNTGQRRTNAYTVIAGRTKRGERDKSMIDCEAGTAPWIAVKGHDPRPSRRNGRPAPRSAPLAAPGLAALLFFASVVASACSAATNAPSNPAKSVALLNVQFLNDHADLEPTTSAERTRIALIASVFKAKLEASGQYTFVAIPSDLSAKIDAGPEVGACGGCEFGYGTILRADAVAWIVIQKVSDLILNINVYMADVSAKKLTFMHSVDIRGDTDESWTRGIVYLVKNYLLPAQGQP
jgi:Protein of unknown function (DUF2380)